MKRSPLIIAHRGASGEAPENTLAAFALALKQGSEAIELDVHLSADRRVIVCHDNTVDRTTNGSGAIESLTVEELKQFDAGSWFEGKYAGEKLPLLEEVLELVPPEIEINVEIKGCDSAGICETLAELLRKRGRIDSVFVSSFHFPMLLDIKRLEPSIRTGLLFSKKTHGHLIAADQCGIPIYSLHPHHSWISKDYVEEASRHNLSVYPWTVNEEGKIREMIEAGVSGIITNYPEALKKMIESKREV
jgi:glycerophosphoryl diester phosphodiesterase